MQRTQMEWVVCHRKPERSFFWKGKQLPLCARCTGINLGYITYPLFFFHIVIMPWWASFCLMLPAAIDGYTQAYCDRESTNPLRAATGFLAGAGLMSLACDIGALIGKLIVSIIH